MVKEWKIANIWWCYGGKIVNLHQQRQPIPAPTVPRCRCGRLADGICLAVRPRPRVSDWPTDGIDPIKPGVACATGKAPNRRGPEKWQCLIFGLVQLKAPRHPGRTGTIIGSLWSSSLLPAHILKVSCSISRFGPYLVHKTSCSPPRKEGSQPPLKADVPILSGDYYLQYMIQGTICNLWHKYIWNKAHHVSHVFFSTTKIIDSRSTPPHLQEIQSPPLRISNQPCKFKLISLLLLLSLQSYSLCTTNYISNIPIYFHFTTSFVGQIPAVHYILRT